MYDPNLADASQTYAPVPVTVQCKDCGTAISFFGPVGFCRMCGGPLCAQHTNRRLKFTHTRTEESRNYIIHTKIRTRTLNTEVALCASCHDSHVLSSRRWLKLVAGVCLGLLAFLLIVLYVAGLWLQNTVCVSVGGVVLLTIALLALVGDRGNEKIKPTCPVCGSDAVPYFYAQNPFYGEGEWTFPNHIQCVCGYSGPVAPLDGLWKYVETWGPDALAGTPYADVARHSWNARRQFRRT